MAMDDKSLVFHCFGLLSVITELLQFIEGGSRGGGILPEGKIIPLSMSITLITLAASVSLPLRPLYITICCRLSLCSSLFTCSCLLSPFVPSKLFLVPYIACVFPLLHLLQLLLPDPLQRSLQQIWCDIWKAIRVAACSAYDATVGSLKALLQSSTAATSTASETSTSASLAAALSIEEGNPNVINGRRLAFNCQSRRLQSI
eukprot:TRINITY_DN4101_c0_g1_i10.p1 TRINITY_DN4101_c0_g1~~TRINITY_DN4101_c0_g1_i10.p1  ORF type:complete len:202 (+),score=10.42 TRINITY_DN4101_c0_g1_i10:644-1249(+)